MTDVISRYPRIDAFPPQHINASDAGAVEAKVGEAAPFEKVFPDLRPIIRHLISETFALLLEPSKERNQLRVQHLCLIATTLGVEGDCSLDQIDIIKRDTGFTESADVQHGNVPGDLHGFIVRVLAALGFEACFDNRDLLIGKLRLDLADRSFNPELQTGVGVGSLSQNGLAHNGRKELKLHSRGVVLSVTEPQLYELPVGRPPRDIVGAMLTIEQARGGDVLDSQVRAQSEPRLPGSLQGQRIDVVNNEEVFDPRPILPTTSARSCEFVRGMLSAKLASLPRLLSIIAAEAGRFIPWASRQRVGIADVPERASLLRVETRHSSVGAVSVLKLTKVYCKPLKATKRHLLATACREFDSPPSHAYEDRTQCSASAVTPRLSNLSRVSQGRVIRTRQPKESICRMN